jgi:primase-polymerase (primpol)-like protein
MFDHIPDELKKTVSWLLWKEVTTEYGFKEILPCSIDGNPLKLINLDEQKDLLKS